ncbi:PRC-barrel domain-containing protein [Paracoccus thiocyanatus]|nr:PRC-barrel domain-containing protein [Paracoccus thiocyanatus]
MPVTPPDVNPPAISEADPGVLSSWLTSRRIWTTNQPSTTEWTDPAVEERPAEWQDIAKVNDIVLDDSGQVVGYIADIGGFLGIGAKKVLLGVDAIHLITIGNDTFFATNYTKAELEALPDFDQKTVRQ